MEHLFLFGKLALLGFVGHDKLYFLNISPFKWMVSVIPQLAPWYLNENKDRELFIILDGKNISNRY